MIPNTMIDQMRQDYFVPDHVIAVFFATSKFDKVCKLNEDGTYSQAYADIPKAKEDCETLRECLSKYTKKEVDYVYNIDSDPTEKEIRNVFKQVDTKLR